MKPSWDDVNARARGLAGHLLSPAELSALARHPDLPSLAAALGRAGLVPGVDGNGADGSDLELGVRRWGAASFRILSRWTGARSAALPLVFSEEDRRSIRAIVRGIVARVGPQQRIAGLIPTPTLPERALQELASLSTVADVSALLSAWRHPFAGALAEVTRAAEPDLLAVELALGKAAAATAVSAARRSGSKALQHWVAGAIDLENGVVALLLAGAGADLDPAAHFLPGGHRLIRGRFLEAVAAGSPAAAGVRLAPAFSGTPYADAFEREGRDPVRLEGELTALRLHALTRQMREAPLEPTTTLWYALRLHDQVIDLQRIIWAVVLDVPRQSLVDRFSTVTA